MASSSRWSSLARSSARTQLRHPSPSLAPPRTCKGVAFASTSAPSAPPKISRIVDDISSLTLIEAADLVQSLKQRLNIQEVAMPSATLAATAPAAAEAEDAPAEKPKEKTIFNIKLESFEAAAKPKMIKEIKTLIPGLTLMDAKKLVESVPKVIKENMPKDEAEALKKTLEGLGGVVKLE